MRQKMGKFGSHHDLFEVSDFWFGSNLIDTNFGLDFVLWCQLDNFEKTKISVSAMLPKNL